MGQYSITDPTTGRTVTATLPRAPKTEAEVLYIFSHPQSMGPASMMAEPPPMPPMASHGPAPQQMPQVPQAPQMQMPDMPMMPAHQPQPPQQMRTAGPLNLNPQSSGLSMLEELAAQPVQGMEEPQEPMQPMSSHEPPQQDPSLWQKLNTPMLALPRAEMRPTEEIGVDMAKNAGSLGAAMRGIEDVVRGTGNVGAGVVEGMSSPLGIASAAASGGGALAGRAGWLSVGQVARAAEAALSAPYVAHGAYTAATADTPEEAFAGGFEAALGGVGVRAGLSTRGFTPVRYNKKRVFETAVGQNKAGSSLTDTAPQMLLQHRSGDPIFYGVNKTDAGYDLVSVMNNSKRGGTLKSIMEDAIKRGANTLDAWSVRSEKFPEGMLPTLYERYGWKLTDQKPYDLSYGAPTEELKSAWRTQGWKDGDPIPDVVYMELGPRTDAAGQSPHISRQSAATARSGSQPSLSSITDRARQTVNASASVISDVAVALARTPVAMFELLAKPKPTDKGVEFVRKAFADYMKANGIDPQNIVPVTSVDETYAKSVADAYEAMRHAPDDPETLRKYLKFTEEVKAQFVWLTEKAGLKIEPWTGPGQPYKNSAEMVADVRNNKRLYFYQSADEPVRPGSELRGEIRKNFRGVHDAVHAQYGDEFGPIGETNVGMRHATTFSSDAMDAAFTETFGQNYWVNYGPHIRRTDGSIPKKGDPDYVPLADRPYAEQKSGLLPAQFRKVAPYGPFKAQAMLAPVLLPYVDTGNEDLDAAIRIGIVASGAAAFGAAAWHQYKTPLLKARVLVTGQLAVKKPLAEIRALLESQDMHLTDVQFKRAVTFGRGKLADIKKATRGQFNNIEQIKSFIEDGLTHRYWYEEGAELIAEGRKAGWITNDEEERVFAGFLGAMGSQNPPKQNFRDAWDLYQSYKNGTLRIGANGKMIMPKDWNPKTPGLDNVEAVLKGEPLGGRKIETYEGSMAGRAGYDQKLVADRWIARLHGFREGSRAALGNVDDHTYEAMEQIWKQIAKDYDISVSQAQAAGWFGIRQKAMLVGSERKTAALAELRAALANAPSPAQRADISAKIKKLEHRTWVRAPQGHPMLQQKHLFDAEKRWIDKGYYEVRTSVDKKTGATEYLLALTPKGMKVIGARAKQLAAFLKTDAGGTVNVLTGRGLPEAGYVVSAFPERTLVVPKGIEVTPSHVSGFIQDNLDLLEEADVNVGAWREEKSGRTFLDLSLVLGDRHTALEEGARRGGKAIYDLSQKQVVEIPRKPGLPDVGRIYDRIGSLRSKLAPTGSEALDAVDEMETGKPFTFNALRNTTKAPNMGERFGQHVEPAGRYLVDTGDYVGAGDDPENLTRSVVTFQSPLVIDFGGGYESADNWKHILSKRYDGKTGKALSKAIAKDGYDGIVTTETVRGETHTSEIVDLSSVSR